MNAALFAEFDAPAREALLQAVEANRQELDALADEYQREAIATAQSEAAYQAATKEYNRE